MCPVITTYNNVDSHLPQQVTRECRYCSGFLRQKRSIESQKPWDTILYETDNFVVVPSLGSLVEGWLLIVSKQHYLCMGSVPSFLDSELQEITELTRKALAHCYIQPTVFEHGPSREGLTIGCGIDHAHFHVVPLPISLLDAAKKGPELREVLWFRSRYSFLTLQQLYQRGKSYLYIREPSSESFYCTPDTVPCQCLQRVIARRLGITMKDGYDENSFLEDVNNTLKRIRPYFVSR